MSEQEGQGKSRTSVRAAAALAPAPKKVELAAPVVRPAARIVKAPRKAIASLVQAGSVEVNLARTKRSHRNRGSRLGFQLWPGAGERA